MGFYDSMLLTGVQYNAPNMTKTGEEFDPWSGIKARRWQTKAPFPPIYANRGDQPNYFG